MREEILSRDVLYRGVFGILKLKLRLASGDVTEREVVEAPGGSAVLPFDPDRRVALMISQTRAPLLEEGAPSMLEVIAGAYDEDPPETCARREALEEGGVRLGDLEHIACAWASPANSTERVDYFLAEYRLSDRVESGGGLDEEQEEISVCEVPLQNLASMLREGRIADVKTLVLIQALQLRHPHLFE